MKADSERLFFALWPRAGWQNACLSQATKLLPNATGRWIPARNLHITLAFLGSVSGEQRTCLEKAADQVDAEGFKLEFAKLRYRPRNKIVWATPDITPPALANLVDQLRAVLPRCGLVAERGVFAPHLTLLRRAGRVAAMPGASIPPWSVESFSLIRSQTLPGGAIYETVRVWPLRVIAGL